MSPDATHDAEDRLDKERRLHLPAVHEVGQIVEMSYVIALELEARFVLRARLQGELDVLEGVSEDQIPCALQVLRFPCVLELLETFQHGEESEVYRSHVERSQLRLQLHGGPDALLDPHGGCASTRQVDDHVHRFLDLAHKWQKHIGILRGLACLRIASVQVNDGGPGTCRRNGGLGDLLRRDGQIWRHGWRVDGAGNGTADNGFIAALRRHGSSFLGLHDNRFATSST